MVTMRQGIEVDLWLKKVGWDTTSGGSVIFEITKEDVEKFAAMKTRSGKKVAGQRLTGWLVLIDDDESVVPAEQAAKEPGKAWMMPDGSKVPAPADAITGHRMDEPAKHGKRGFSPEVGPLARLAVLWCDDPDFHLWLQANYGERWATACQDTFDGPAAIAKRVLLGMCKIDSRKELDTNENAAKLFDSYIRHPYSEDLKAAA